MDIAGSVSLHRKVNAFLQLTAFELSPGYARVMEKLMEESGLLEESAETLIEMRVALREFEERKQKAEASRQKARGAARRR